jgi:transcriptional regulator of NAD metabolism
MSMSVEEIIRRLRRSNQAQVSRDTGLSYRYIRHLVDEHIKNPGTRQMDALRAYFAAKKSQQ